MAGRGPFSISGTDMNSPITSANTAAPRPQIDHQMPMPFNEDSSAGLFGQMGSSPIPFQPAPASNAVINHLGMSENTEQRRKRGRPRKYAPDGGSAAGVNASQPQTFSPQEGGAGVPAKRPRGRPRGSCNKKPRKETLGSTGTGFKPHVFNVNAGEDVSSKILAFTQKDGSRGVCVLSAIGAISRVSLYQASSSGGTADYEGHFDLLSLRGSFLLSEAGQNNRSGGLSVLLSGSDGRVLGGCVAGSLIAASPVQIIAGSFLPEANKESKVNTTEPTIPPLNMNISTGDGNGAGSSSPSVGSPSGSSGGGADSPLNF